MRAIEEIRETGWIWEFRDLPVISFGQGMLGRSGPKPGGTVSGITSQWLQAMDKSKGMTSIFWPHRHALYFLLSLSNFSRQDHPIYEWVTSRPWLSGWSVWDHLYSTFMNIFFTLNISKKVSSFKCSNIHNYHGALCCHDQPCSCFWGSLFNCSLAIAISHCRIQRDFETWVKSEAAMLPIWWM